MSLNILDYLSGKNSPINTEEYEESLELELALTKLINSGKITDRDQVILINYIEGYSNRKSAKMLGIDRRKVSNRLSKIFEWLAEELE